MIKAVQELYINLSGPEKVLSSSCGLSGPSGGPQKILSPMAGLMNLPVCSLEKALRGLDDIIPELEQHVAIVTKKCKEATDGLTPDESAAIMIYTLEWEPRDSSIYNILNQTLRSESGHALKKWFPYLRLLLHALNKLPLYRGTVCSLIRADTTNGYKIGEQITWWGFSTTTDNRSVFESFHFLPQDDARTIFSIECQNGKSIGKYSYFPNEEEILLLPGSQFVVSDISYTENGLRLIRLQEIGDPYSLY